MKEDIIRMAREAGFTTAQDVWPQEFERFAALVRADERKACLNCYSPDDTAEDWADKIRARGQA
jgi:hypothetical protein